MPFVLSPSNHERPFDKLRANGLQSIFATMMKEVIVIARSASDAAISARWLRTVRLLRCPFAALRASARNDGQLTRLCEARSAEAISVGRWLCGGTSSPARGERTRTTAKTRGLSPLFQVGPPTMKMPVSR